MRGTYRRIDAAERAALEDVIRRRHAEHAAAGRCRPTGDELYEAAGGRWGAGHLNAIARRLRAAGEVPDLPRPPRTAYTAAGPAEAEARRAAMAAGRAAAAASRAAAAADLPPGRRWAREHMERERRLGIGRGAKGRTSRR